MAGGIRPQLADLGAVHVDDCDSAVWQSKPVVKIERCRLVTLSRCHLEQTSFNGDGEESGARIDDSNVVISACTFSTLLSMSR